MMWDTILHASRGVPGNGCLGKLASNTVVSDLRASRAIDDVKQLTSPSSQTYSSFLPLYKSPARYVPVDVSIQGPSASTNISWSGRARTRLPSSKTTLYLECTHASRKLRSRITGKCTSSPLRVYSTQDSQQCAQTLLHADCSCTEQLVTCRTTNATHVI